MIVSSSIATSSRTWLGISPIRRPNAPPCQLDSHVLLPVLVRMGREVDSTRMTDLRTGVCLVPVVYGKRDMGRRK